MGQKVKAVAALAQQNQAAGVDQVVLVQVVEADHSAFPKVNEKL